MKPRHTQRTINRVVAEREEVKKPFSITFPMWSTPNHKPGDVLLTRWYGGVGIRDLPPSVDEILGIEKTYRANPDEFVYIKD